MSRYRKVISPVDDIPAVLSKAVRQPSSSLSNVHYRWTFGAWQTINHVISGTGKMSRDVNMPFGCCNCGWWIDMGTCAATCPVTRKSTWWLVWKVSTNDFPANQVPGMEGGDRWCSTLLRFFHLFLTFLHCRNRALWNLESLTIAYITWKCDVII